MKKNNTSLPLWSLDGELKLKFETSKYKLKDILFLFLQYLFMVLIYFLGTVLAYRDLKVIMIYWGREICK